MPRTDVEDQADIGFEHGTELVHVVGMADARLHAPERLVAVRRQHGQGQPDLVVQVHTGLGGLSTAAQHLREQFLDRGLARGAGEPDDAGVRPETLAPVMRQTAQRRHRVVHEDDRNRRHAVERIARGEQCGGSGFDGLAREVVPVERFAGNADEQGPRSHGPAVRARADDGPGGHGRPRDEGTADGPDDIFKNQAHPRISRTVC